MFEQLVLWFKGVFRSRGAVAFMGIALVGSIGGVTLIGLSDSESPLAKSALSYLGIVLLPLVIGLVVSAPSANERMRDQNNRFSLEMERLRNQKERL